MSTNATKELVTLTIDGKQVQVPKGTNLIEAAKIAGVDIPHYCYHPQLSIAGNCRMCQISVKGQPKLNIACNTMAAEGMDVSTQATNKDVADAQAATLEFILINHPLDCTVCDQAGHCKLQDYHFEYNARESRFLEEKVHKDKAVPLGPTVMLDGERCIMCTRCVRFCDEITKTSELGMLNRGDRSVISISPGRELNNPLSGTVVDLCPVGALTHKEWRFNTRIWFTNQVDSICTRCSTGCNVKVASRDGQIVQVKARRNDHVNKEWLCDYGRYGFNEGIPTARLNSVLEVTANGEKSTELKDAFAKAKDLFSNAAIFVSPDVLLEELFVIKALIQKAGSTAKVYMPYRERQLSEVEKILVSPDRSANFRGAQFLGLISDQPEKDYENALAALRGASYQSILCIGDRAIDQKDLTPEVLQGISRAAISAGIITDHDSSLAGALKILLPGRLVIEKSGLMINRQNRLQMLQRAVEPPKSSEADLRILLRFAQAQGITPLGNLDLNIASDRDLSRALLQAEDKLKGLTLNLIKGQGVDLNSIAELKPENIAQVEIGAPA